MEIKQSVNFYRDEFKKPDIKLPAKQVVQVVSAVLVGLILLGSYQTWELQALKTAIVVKETHRNQLNEQYEQLEAGFVEPTEDPALLARLRALNDDAIQKQKLRDFLLRESGKSLFSFAGVLDGLAGSVVRNVWLTEIHIATEGSRYELQGITQHADAIPQYIETLKQTPALQGASFSIFNIERDLKSDGLLHFTLSSEPPSESEAIGGNVQ